MSHECRKSTHNPAREPSGSSGKNRSRSSCVTWGSTRVLSGNGVDQGRAKRGETDRLRADDFAESGFSTWVKDPTTGRANLTEPEPAQDDTTTMGWRAGQHTVADSMRRQGLLAR